MIAWARTASILLGALAVFAGAAAQLVAALLAYHPALGQGFAELGGVRFFAPWEILRWAFLWAPHRPWLALLIVVLIGACFLAALAIAALASALEPASLTLRRSRRGYERWATLSQRGRLGASGLALGAVRRHEWARPDFIRHEHGHVLLLGDPKLTDDALIAAISTWDGALVLVDAADLSSKLARTNVVRFAPGRVDTIALNPLFNIRGGAHAWSDARLLARAFLRTGDAVLVDAFAALTLDTLATAPIAIRSLAGMRQRLADPARQLSEMCARWLDGACDLGPATGELARIVRTWRRDGEAALRAFAEIDAALSLFANGDYVLASEGHQLRFADLAAGDGPGCLIVAPPAGDGVRAAPMVNALLAQLVAACGPSSDLDQFGRCKQRRLLVVIEGEALVGLISGKRGAASLFDAFMRNTQGRGCEFIIQARCASYVLALLRAAGEESAAALNAAFSAIAAIGPQTQASAETLSEMAGEVDFWNRMRTFRAPWKDWLLPRWERASASIVSAELVRDAAAEDELLLLQGYNPIRCAPLVGGQGHPVFLSPDALPPAPHDWTAPPLVKSAVPTLASAPSPGGHSAAARTAAGSQIRRALARKAAPRLKSDGDRLL